MRNNKQLWIKWQKIQWLNHNEMTEAPAGPKKQAGAPAGPKGKWPEPRPDQKNPAGFLNSGRTNKNPAGLVRPENILCCDSKKKT